MVRCTWPWQLLHVMPPTWKVLSESIAIKRTCSKGAAAETLQCNLFGWQLLENSKLLQHRYINSSDIDRRLVVSSGSAITKVNGSGPNAPAVMNWRVATPTMMMLCRCDDDDALPMPRGGGATGNSGEQWQHATHHNCGREEEREREIRKGDKQLCHDVMIKPESCYRNGCRDNWLGVYGGTVW